MNGLGDHVAGGGAREREAEPAREESLRFYLERSPLMMGTVALLPDGDLLHLYDNPATTAFFGVPAGATEGRTAREMDVPETAIALWRDHYRLARDSAAHCSFEYTHPLASGPRRVSVTVTYLGSESERGEPLFSYIAENVTARRMMESALEQSEASLRGVFEQAAVGLALVAVDGRWLRVNRRLREMLGYSEAEMASLTFQDISHPDELGLDLANVERLLAGETTSYTIEKRYFRRDGSEMWAQLTVSLLRHDNGDPDRFVAVVEDISERKSVQSRLALAERRLAMATRASGLGVWEWSSADETVHYSARAREICGFGADQPLGIETIIAAIHPDDREAVAARARRERTADELSSIEYRIVHPQQGVRWVRAFSTAVADSGGQAPVRLFGALEDITDQRRMMDRLQTSEARLRLALEAGRMAVFEWPLTEREPEMTPELRAQFGLADDRDGSLEARRRRYHPDDAALVRSTRERALRGDERFLDFVFRYFRPDGDMRWLEVRSEVLRQDSGDPDRLVGVQMDITEQREKEDRLRLLVHEVDHRANNLLSVVQSFVSLSKAADIEGLRAVLARRIQALAHTQQLLSESRWAGADLGRIIAEELGPYGLEDQARVQLAGPAVALAPTQAQGVGLVLHELATNAAKHGSLSVASGRLMLSWRCLDGVLHILWREEGGPPVRAPTRRGFGLTLLNRSLGGVSEGGVDLDWSGQGLVAQIRLRVQTPLEAAGGAPGGGPIAGSGLAAAPSSD